MRGEKAGSILNPKVFCPISGKKKSWGQGGTTTIVFKYAGVSQKGKKTILVDGKLKQYIYFGSLKFKRVQCEKES